MVGFMVGTMVGTMVGFMVGFMVGRINTASIGENKAAIEEVNNRCNLINDDIQVVSAKVDRALELLELIANESPSSGDSRTSSDDGREHSN